MTPRQRFEAALERDTPDRVPVFLRDLTLGLDVLDVPTPRVCAGRFDAELSSRAVVATQRHLDHDAVVGSIQFCGLETEMLGGRLRFPERGIPTIERPPFIAPEDVDRAELPDPLTDEPMANVVRAHEITSRRIGKEVAVLGNIEGAVTKAGLLRGLEAFLMDLLTDRGLAEKSIEFAARLGEDLAGALASHGADCALFVAAASDNPDLIGPDDFRRYSLPGLRRMVRVAEQHGLPTIFHPHGIFTDTQFSSLVPGSIEQGIAGFQFAEGNDLALAKREWGGETCVLGGVDAFTTLLLGPEERIAAETRRCLEDCGTSGYVMMCSCSLHRGIPLGNVRTMVDACHRWSDGVL
ncbi:MAG: uroporphyrinogen decarboxylase family protein [Methanomassiliicoccus sp.]|nr:uroporphyrinogen decarboxylase family protein [Methanomassiliicoccus sp.]